MELLRCPSPETVTSHLTNSIRSNRVKDHVCHFNKCTIVNLKGRNSQEPKDPEIWHTGSVHEIFRGSIRTHW